MPWKPYRRMPCRSESSKGIAYREARSGSVTWKEVSNTATIGTGRPTAARAARIPAMLGGLWSGAISSRESIASVTVSSIRVVPGKFLPPWTTRCPIASIRFPPSGNRMGAAESTHASTRRTAPADPLDVPPGQAPFTRYSPGLRLHFRDQELEGGTSAVEYQDVHVSPFLHYFRRRPVGEGESFAMFLRAAGENYFAGTDIRRFPGLLSCKNRAGKSD